MTIPGLDELCAEPQCRVPGCSEAELRHADELPITKHFYRLPNRLGRLGAGVDRRSGGVRIINPYGNGRYRNAFSGLDSGAARAVWPSVDVRALDRAFDRLEEQALEFENCDIDVNGPRAIASCEGSARYVPKVGNRNAQVAARQWRFNLRKVNEAWLIEEVDSR